MLTNGTIGTDVGFLIEYDATMTLPIIAVPDCPEPKVTEVTSQLREMSILTPPEAE